MNDDVETRFEQTVRNLLKAKPMSQKAIAETVRGRRAAKKLSELELDMLIALVEAYEYMDGDDAAEADLMGKFFASTEAILGALKDYRALRRRT